MFLKTLLLAIAVGITGGLLSAAADPPTLTETQRLRAQLHQAQSALLQARMQLATCEANAAAAMLARDRAQLEQDFLAGQTGLVFDWTTLTVKPQPQP